MVMPLRLLFQEKNTGVLDDTVNRASALALAINRGAAGLASKTIAYIALPPAVAASNDMEWL
ncbi:hypothetical protein JaAD80_20530 [Janthinobacterium sp. AD80]|nr:hypothetical protein JaAD80_20530 [Janthinobacterium sp. AD80]